MTDEAQAKQDNFFFQMHQQDRINEMKAAAPDQTAVKKQEEMQAYWREMLNLNGLGKEKAPKSGAELLVNRKIWRTL